MIISIEETLFTVLVENEATVLVSKTVNGKQLDYFIPKAALIREESDSMFTQKNRFRLSKEYGIQEQETFRSLFQIKAGNGIQYVIEKESSYQKKQDHSKAVQLLFPETLKTEGWNK